MRVLVACEFSGVVREALNAISGVEATSCDLIPCEDGRTDYHIIGDALDLLNDGWDALLGFPPCTYLTVSANRWQHDHWIKNKDRKKWRWHDGAFHRAERIKAVDFFLALANAPIKKIAIENPIGIMSTRWRKPDQIIQPWMFGHGEIKATCLWLKGFPELNPSRIVKGRKPRVHHASPGPNRWKERSRTLPGIARAMADQWFAEEGF